MSVIIRAPVLFTLRAVSDGRLILWIMIAGVFLVIIVSLYRLLPVMLGIKEQQPDWLINVSPMTALCFCGAALLPRRWAITLPFAALLGTDLFLNSYYGHPLFNAEFIVKTLVMVIIAAFGWQLRANPRLRVLLPGAIAGSLFFYVATNTASWLYDPAYVKNFSGWAQALTTGLPSYQPTWTFYQNTFISDVAFTILFVVCVRPMPHLAREEKAAAAAW